jgi:micrococcal nuclease
MTVPEVKPIRRKTKRGAISGCLLAGILIASLVQYLDKGEVTWITDGFRFIETSARQLVDRVQLTPANLESAARQPGKIDQKTRFANALVGRITSVKDGDSVMLMDDDWHSHEIRLQGIDAPEKDQPYGLSSKVALGKMILGRRVAVDVTGPDKYNRTLGTLYLDDSNIDVAMVRGGHAWWYRYYHPDNRELARAEKQARDKQLGLWQLEDPVPPWVWRRSRRR